MKRSYIGLFLLIALLLVSFWLSGMAAARCRSLYPLVEKAGALGLRNRWEDAAETLSDAREAWENHGLLRSCLFPHQALEDIDTGFAELSAYLAARENIAFCALCGGLSCQIRALEDACRVSWQNLF